MPACALPVAVPPIDIVPGGLHSSEACPGAALPAFPDPPPPPPANQTF